ncbi:hypothetical protein PMIN06_012714 [Paraphaeosphaeria minitans]
MALFLEFFNIGRLIFVFCVHDDPFDMEYLAHRQADKPTRQQGNKATRQQANKPTSQQANKPTSQQVDKLRRAVLGRDRTASHKPPTRPQPRAPAANLR